jgi:hypothetical protein
LPVEAATNSPVCADNKQQRQMQCCIQADNSSSCKPGTNHLPAARVALLHTAQGAALTDCHVIVMRHSYTHQQQLCLATCAQHYMALQARQKKAELSSSLVVHSPLHPVLHHPYHKELLCGPQ